MKKRLATILSLSALSILVVISAFYFVFDIPNQASLLVQDRTGWSETKKCYVNPEAKVLDKRGEINILVWNIYKQNRETAMSQLSTYSAGSQLLLLQEASLNNELKQWITSRDWDSNLVRAFDAFDTSAGVVSLSSSLPLKACAYIEKEPLLRLPKSALYTRYPLENGQELAVINVHAINFTIGTETYAHQLEVLQEAVQQHQGPLILAGDFNTWSDNRLEALKRITRELQLSEVKMEPDNRKTFITGLPLDHVFYKNLTLINAEAPITDASDHNPILVRFRTEGSALSLE
ncbi:endonuclease/exonuclease/phosphatase family protein [Vibrio sp. HN007]|uniref:endonuclease/exonuclease/phosphatase family protein n=1 Tax=Vibrio iocasae TaxID=3098914 RepID=UPI0035D3E5CC